MTGIGHKRYLAFAFLDYYPQGGWNDCVGLFYTSQEAFAAAKDSPYDDNIQVIDLLTGDEIDEDAEDE